MVRLHSLALALVVIAGGFFEQGCTSGYMKEKGGDLLEGLVERGKELVKNEMAAALPALEEKALAFAEKKLAEREAKDLATIDAQLALLGSIDSVTGLLTAKTWRDFDADHDGHPSSGELLKMGAYVSAEGMKRVMAGTMSKDTFLGMEKTTGVASTSLLGGAIATWAITNRRKKAVPDASPQKPVAAGPPPPLPPAPNPA